MKNLVMTMLVLLFSGTVLFANGKKDDVQLNQAKVIRVGWQATGSVKFIGEGQGFIEREFGKDGIKFEFVQFTYGPPIIEALATGDLDFGLVGDMPIVTAIANGLPVQSVFKHGIDPNSNILLVPVNSPIQSIYDLKNKRIGTGIGSSAHHFLILLLEQAGISVDDVEIVNLTPTDLGSALATGQLDAGTTWEPYSTIFISRGFARAVIKSEGIKQNTNNEVASKEFIEKNPDLTARYLKVLLEINDFIQQDRLRAIKIISEGSGLEESALRPTALANVYEPHFTAYDWEQMEKTKQFLLSMGLIERDFDIKTLYTDKYLNEAERLYKLSK
jgi:sulfonate transport system substrate-binding protein